jgi:hypothetical protein
MWGINGENRHGARVTNDVAHVLIAAGALHGRLSPLHVRRLHHQVRSDDDLIEFARLQQCSQSRTESIITKSHLCSLASNVMCHVHRGLRCVAQSISAQGSGRSVALLLRDRLRHPLDLPDEAKEEGAKAKLPPTPAIRSAWRRLTWLML